MNAQGQPEEVRPEKVIRRYLDEHGGEVEVPARDLVTTWELNRWTAAAKERIAAALEDVGVSTVPPLAETGRDDPVTLYVAESEPTPPPWARPPDEPAETPAYEVQKSESYAGPPTERPLPQDPGRARRPWWRRLLRR
jgi:hypothetical protein